MGEGVDIRRARPGDGEAMAAFTRAIVAEGLDTILLNEPFTAEQEEAVIPQYTPPNGVFMLALDGSTVIGMCDLRAGSRPGARHLGVLGMSVLAPWRGQGIGRRLMEAVIAEARLWPGFCRIELGVVPWNKPAIRLYESLGFVLEGVKRKGIATRGAPEDDLFMALVW